MQLRSEDYWIVCFGYKSAEKTSEWVRYDHKRLKFRKFQGCGKKTNIRTNCNVSPNQDRESCSALELECRISRIGN
jgi:hypothetical protein